MTGYVRPATLDEAVAARAANPGWTVLAGGTDLMVEAPLRAVPAGIIDLWAMPDLTGIQQDPDGIRIGAGTSWLEVMVNPSIMMQAPILSAAAREIGALQIQARGTIGGNIVTSSPVGDSLPALLALDAELELVSARGRRTVAYADFATGYRQTLLAADELVASVRLPPPPAGTWQGWRKVGTRRAQSISKVMAAAAITITDGMITRARFGLGAVADRPIRARAAEASAVGRAPDRATAEVVAEAAVASITPISDVRSTASYRLDLVRRLVMRFVIMAGGQVG
ncbi:MAG TPA: FAD binding domain-containing protein [Kofleriaceae bacterium]|nr:FAD binding domain-containing protein [Kofleriaceae bacterium]